jgi:transcriptional regulator with XRE-family HTH domain
VAERPGSDKGTHAQAERAILESTLFKIYLSRELGAFLAMRYYLGMLINERLKELREAKGFSQGEIEKRTGLLRCYTSRVENGHTVPNLDTLEKYARALEVPLYKLFHDGASSPASLKLLEATEPEWGNNQKESRELRLFAKAISRMNDRQRRLLLHMAAKMASRQ